MGTGRDLRLVGAAERGDLEEVVRLLEGGMDAEIRDSEGMTALMRASREGHERCVELLLPTSDAKAFCRRREMTALMLAAEGGHAGCVERLLPGSDVRARAGGGMTALMWAAVGGHASCVGLLLSASDAKASDKCGRTALMWAALSGDPECVERLLPGSDALALGQGGQTAAELARLRGHGSVSEWIEGYARSIAERDRLEALPKGSGGPKAAGRRI